MIPTMHEGLMQPVSSHLFCPAVEIRIPLRSSRATLLCTAETTVASYMHPGQVSRPKLKGPCCRDTF